MLPNLRRIPVGGIAALVGVAIVLTVSCFVARDRAWDSNLDRELRYRRVMEVVDSIAIVNKDLLRQSREREDSIQTLAEENASLRRRAAVSGARADSLRALRPTTTDRDSLLVIVTAEADARLQETVELKQVIAADSARIRLLTIDRDAWRDRVADLTRINEDLRSVAKEQHDRRECRVVRLFRCPSRTETAVGGAILGGLAVAVIKNRD